MRHAISNSFGFGGQNVSLVMGLEPALTPPSPPPSCARSQLIADRKLELADVPAPPPPGDGEVQMRVKAVALNHLDLWGFRGMAFAKRKLPLIVGAEASGEIAAAGAGVAGFKPGDKVVMYGAMTCGHCPACRDGRDNLCENVGGIMGFHIDGFARDLINLPARLVIPVPAGVSLRDAACAPIAFGTTEHMLFDNAKLKPWRNHFGACRRLRHRFGRHQDGQSDRLHRHHHSR